MEKSIEKKLPKIKQLFTKYNVKSAYLFGSVTTDKFDSESDVDFLYSFSEDLDYEIYGNNYFNLLNDLEKLLNRQVDLVAEKTLKNPYLIESINETKIQLI